MIETKRNYFTAFSLQVIGRRAGKKFRAVTSDSSVGLAESPDSPGFAWVRVAPTVLYNPLSHCVGCLGEILSADRNGPWEVSLAPGCGAASGRTA